MSPPASEDTKSKQLNEFRSSEMLRNAVLEEVVSMGNDVEELEQSLQDTIREEEDLKQRIKSILEDSSEKSDDFERTLQEDFTRTLGSLKVSIPTLQIVYKGAAKLDGRITETREMADVVSKRVREIDLARSRALLALGKVRRIMELRTCLKGVKESMHKGDLETASDFIFRYRQSEEGDAANDTDEDGEANKDFQRCEESLSHAILDELNLAIERHEDDKVLQGCRIFAKLGQAREGLSRLLQYRCEQLRSDVMMEIEIASVDSSSSSRDYEYGQTSEQQPYEQEEPPKTKSFLDLLIYLLNQGAAMIQRTQQIVKRNISDAPELQGQVVLSIHAECDKLITHILKMFMEKRRIEERVRIVIERPDQLGEAMSLGASSWLKADISQSESIFALDTLLDDIALMLKHTETYNSFIHSRRDEVQLEDSILILKSEATNVVQELAGYYSILEETYMCTAIQAALEKEVALDHLSTLSSHSSEEQDDGVSEVKATKQIVVSSVAEDAFYVIDKCRDRAMATRHVDSVCAVVNNIVKVLEERLSSLLQRRVSAIKDDFQSLALHHGSEQFDRLKAVALSQAQALSSSPHKPANASPPDELKTTETTLNSLSLCVVYTDKLRVELEQYAEGLQSEKLRHKLKNCVDGLLETIEVFQRSLSSGLDKVVNIIKPRLRDQMDSSVGLQTTSFELTEGEYLSHNEGNDPYVRSLLQLTDTLLVESTSKLDLENSKKVGFRCAGFLCKGVEYAVVRKQFTPFGALLLDKQLRSIVGFFEGRFGSEAKLSFKRLYQICDLLNLDRVEDVHDVYMVTTSSNPALSSKEVKRVLALRVDFRTEDIKRLKI